MAKLITVPLTSLTNELSAVANINSNFDAVETAMENTLSRDGTSPNQMGADLDMDSNDILNVGTLQATTAIINGGDITDAVQRAVDAADDAEGYRDSALTYSTEAATSASEAASSASDAETVLAGALLKTNNLSDLSNVATSRTNLGLGTAATQASSTFATASQGTKADSAVQSIVAGDNVTVDVTDPQNPIVSSTGGSVTGLFYFVEDYGAVGDGVTDDAPAFRSAVAAIPDGANLILGPKKYLLDTASSGAVIKLTDKVVSFIGSGWSYGGGTQLLLGALSTTDDVFNLSGTKSLAGYVFRDFLVCPKAGVNHTGVGQNCFHIDSTGDINYLVATSVWDHLFIDNMSTGRSFYFQSNTSSLSGGVAYSRIQNCEFKQFSGSYVGDNIMLDHNIIGFNISLTTSPDVFFYNITGAANFIISNNVIAGGKGHIYCAGGTSPVVAFNELENADTTAGIAMIDMAGSVSIITTPLITGNSISQNAAAAVMPISVENATGAIIENNRISKPTDTAKPIVISSAAVNTTIGVNKYYVGGTWITTGYLSDAGTNTTEIFATGTGTWTPALTPFGGGTITAGTCTGSYTRRGKDIDFTLSVTLTTVTGTVSSFNISLPSSTGAVTSFVGLETVAVGTIVKGSQNSPLPSFNVTKYDNTTIAVNGAVIVVSGHYREA